MPKWSDFGNIWTTLRELDINAIREEAERPLAIACVGHEAALDALDRLLHSGTSHYPAAANPLEMIPLSQASGRAAGVSGAVMGGVVAASAVLGRDALADLAGDK